jgi:hypothetical protein
MATEREVFLGVEPTDIVIGAGERVVVKYPFDGAFFQVALDVPSGPYRARAVFGDEAGAWLVGLVKPYEPYGVSLVREGSVKEKVFVYDEVAPLADSRRHRGIVELR